MTEKLQVTEIDYEIFSLPKKEIKILDKYIFKDKQLRLKIIPIIKRFSTFLRSILTEILNILFLCKKKWNYFSTGREKWV